MFHYNFGLTRVTLNIYLYIMQIANAHVPYCGRGCEAPDSSSLVSGDEDGSRPSESPSKV